VLDRLTAIEAKRLGIVVSDEELEREVARAPQFQRDGKFIGAPEIRRLLELQGSTPQEFEADLRRSLVRERLEALVAGVATVTDVEVEREYRRRNEQIRSEYVRIEASQAGLDVTEDEVKERFEKQKDAYRLPEKRVVSFVLVDESALRRRVTVTDRDIETHYQDNKDEFREEEQACASQVLIKVKSDPAEKDGHPDAEAQALAAKLLEAVRGARTSRLSPEDPPRTKARPPAEATWAVSRAAVCCRSSRASLSRWRLAKSPTRSERPSATTSSGWRRSGRRRHSPSAR